jgi:hypothetical protein
MPDDVQDEQEAVEQSDTVPLSPEWGGVPRSGGDAADATGGPPTEAVDVTPEATDAGEAGEEAGEPEAGGEAEAGEEAEAGGEPEAGAEAGEAEAGEEAGVTAAGEDGPTDASEE